MSTKILVVEDDVEINELLGEYLALENMQPLSATTGQQGIHLAQAQHPDAIILDLMLPDIDGFEVARTLTTDRSTFDIPIIILSCMNQTCDREKGFCSGALHYMNKPFLPDDLLATLRTAAEWRKALRSRSPAGRMTLGNLDDCALGTALHDFTADLFARTSLSNQAVADRRAAVETLNQWTLRWNREHAADRGGKTQLIFDYRITPASTEFTLTETGNPGLLSDAFFKLPIISNTGKILGWGASMLGMSLNTPTDLPQQPPPQPWLELLEKIGGLSYQRDPKSRTVRITPSPLVSPTASSPAPTPATA